MDMRELSKTCRLLGDSLALDLRPQRHGILRGLGLLEIGPMSLLESGGGLLGFLKKSVGAGGPWKAKIMRVEGEKLSLDDIEHGIMRPFFKDPRVHYAVNCAALGCPNLMVKAFTEGNAEAMLEAAPGIERDGNEYSVDEGHSLSVYIGQPGQAMEVSEVAKLRLDEAFCEATSREHQTVYLVEYSSLHGLCVRPPSGGGGRRAGFS